MRPSAVLLLWAAVITSCIGASLYKTASGRAFDADFLALLPAAEGDPLRIAAEARLEGAMERQTIWLLGADSAMAAATGADRLARRLDDSRLFEEPAADVAAARSIENLYEFRFQLLPPPIAGAIRDDADGFAARSFAEVFSPLGAHRLASLATDPLGLFPAYVNRLVPGRMSPVAEDRAAVVDGARHWIVVYRTLKGDTFDLTTLERLQELVHATRSEVPAGAEILISGLPLFAADGAARARGEISTVGVGSLLLIVMLLTSVFRSTVPMLLAVASIASGLCLALAVSLFLFDGLHLISLVFGATLVGVSIDYALHYLCDSLRSALWDPKAAIARILPGIGLSLSTTALAYASMALSPLPALRQIAVFSVIGLAGAWLTVVVLLPLLGHRWPFRDVGRFVGVAQLPGRVIAIDSNRTIVGGTVAATIIVSALILTMAVDDDVRSMQSPDERLLSDSSAIAAITGVGRDTQFLLVRGADVEETLARELLATRVLDAAREAQRLNGYAAISAHYPSPSTQAANFALLASAMYHEGENGMRAMLTRLGARSEVVERHLDAFRSSAGLQLPIDAWLAAVGSPWRDLWLGCADDECASIVTMNGYASLTASERADLEALAGVQIVDRAGDITDLLGAFRVTATRLLVLGCVVIAIVLAVRFGAMGAVRIVCVPLGAVLATLLLMAVLGIAASLFTVFALMLVIGLAFDYGIFNHLHGRERFTSLAILLSALTTLAAFGLLALSGTAVVSQFGVTLGIGVLAAYLLGPLAAPSSSVLR